MFSIFHDTWSSLGYTWEQFLDWSDHHHIQAMQSTHVENDPAESHIRRWETS